MERGYISEIFVSLQGEGAHVGRRHLFVRLAGCNIRCRYCDTPDSLQRAATYTVHGDKGRTTTASNPAAAADLRRLLGAMLQNRAPIDAIALTGGEPLMQSGFLAALLGAGRFAVPVLLETNGILPGRLREVLSLVDIISMDIKLPSNTGERAFWEAHAEFLEMARERELYVKLLVDQSTADEEVAHALSLLADIGLQVPAFMQPIVDAAGNPMIAADRLDELYVSARRHWSSLRVLPQVHKLLGLR